jgi:hypothetical protein
VGKKAALVVAILIALLAVPSASDAWCAAARDSGGSCFWCEPGVYGFEWCVPYYMDAACRCTLWYDLCFPREFCDFIDCSGYPCNARQQRYVPFFERNARCRKPAPPRSCAFPSKA